MKKDTVMVIGDTHAPFAHPDALKFLARMKKEYEPTTIIHIGDIVDQCALSAFVKGPTSMNAQQELWAAKEWIKKLGKLFPVLTCTLGNHDLRWLKRASEMGIPGEYLKDFRDVIEAPKGWTFVDQHERKGITYVHGDGFTGQSAAINIIKHKMTNCTFGHTHQSVIQFMNGKFGFNVGCLIDPDAYCFEYAKHYKIRPELGVGFIINGVPRWEPLR